MGTRTTWVIYAIVLTLAATSLMSVRGPRLPGTLELAVIRGPGSAEMESALLPFAQYLGDTLRRSVNIEVLEPAGLRGGLPAFDVGLIPASLLRDRPELEVLAWAKPTGVSGWRTRSFLVRRRGEVERPRLVLGDSLTWTGDPELRAQLAAVHGLGPEAVASAAYGRDPYDHTEVLAALAHGAYDVCVAREGDLRRALASGLIDAKRFEFQPLGRPHAGFALVASSKLSESARNDLRACALNLDQFRFDRANRRAEAVLQALCRLGLNGFAPVEVLPSLRP